jgi:hypothetical protein
MEASFQALGRDPRQPTSTFEKGAKVLPQPPNTIMKVYPLVYERFDKLDNYAELSR